MQQSAVIRTMQQAMSQGDWASAIATGKQWRANGGIHWGITLNLAICLQRNRQGTPEQLSVLADEALRQSRGHPMARLGCAELAISMGRHEQALVLLESVAGALDSGSIHGQRRNYGAGPECDWAQRRGMGRTRAMAGA